ncbi:hypothetical protein Dsin_009128 [Dipteronia sinensis]|uniref:RNase H type-1 domain-containing protein n=1 Tax=Dipteronia sinensis TaxID=43782 RepID=A0AAE0AQ15_9ROSI|nr:hypothetical protein Dsin_009128 [Dipteronia sinensis]
MTWEMRNQVVFKGIATSVAQDEDIVKFRIAWWFKHHGNGSMLPISTMLLNLPKSFLETKILRKAKVDVWIPPSGDALKFNVDGSSWGNPGSAGIGGVLSDFFGKILGSFSINVGHQDAISAEIMAIHKAVYLCSQTAVLFGKEIKVISDPKVRFRG